MMRRGLLRAAASASAAAAAGTATSISTTSTAAAAAVVTLAAAAPPASRAAWRACGWRALCASPRGAVSAEHYAAPGGRDAGAVVLSGRISRARDAMELAGLLDTWAADAGFNFFHITSAITRLPKASSALRARPYLRPAC
eukprot:jgi/Tetstr1/460244/TSEL_000479.t1